MLPPPSYSSSSFSSSSFFLLLFTLSIVLFFLFLLMSVHQNFLGFDNEKIPFFLSVVGGDSVYRCILWRKTVRRNAFDHTNAYLNIHVHVQAYTHATHMSDNVYLFNIYTYTIYFSGQQKIVLSEFSKWKNSTSKVYTRVSV